MYALEIVNFDISKLQSIYALLLNVANSLYSKLYCINPVSS